jgi:hypothetical protein
MKTVKIAADTNNGLSIADETAEVNFEMSEESIMDQMRKPFDGELIFEASYAFACQLQEVYGVKGFDSIEIE